MKLNLLNLPFILLFFYGCCGDPDTISDPSKIANFHELLSTKKKDSLNVNVDLFVDYSTCVAEAKNSPFYLSIQSKINECKPAYWSIKGDRIKKEAERDENEKVFNLLNNIKEVNNANLIQATKQIAEGNNQAILITDGEYFRDGSSQDNKNFPYQGENFKKWLLKGHEIYIYAEDYIESNQFKKFRYYILFTDSDLKNKNIYNIISKNVQPGSIKLIHLSNRSFYIETNYDGKKFPKVNEVLSLNPDTYISGNNFEFDDFQLDWKAICEYIQNAKDPNTGNEIPGGDYILRGVFLNTKNLEYFKISKIDVKVYEVFDELKKFTENDSKSGKPFKVKQLRPIEDLFTVDTSVFNKTGELVLKLHPNFEGEGLNTCSDKKENVLKVDFVISESKDLFDEKKVFLENVFSWKSIVQGQGRNESVYKSVQNLLQDPNLYPDKVNNGIIYTIYIRTKPSNL